MLFVLGVEGAGARDVQGSILFELDHPADQSVPGGEMGQDPSPVVDENLPEPVLGGRLVSFDAPDAARDNWG